MIASFRIPKPPGALEPFFFTVVQPASTRYRPATDSARKQDEGHSGK